MWTLGPLGFLSPWLLVGLVALPILWLILRAVPPAPVRRRFPGVALLLGLRDYEQEAQRTPWWLLLMRLAAAAALIVGFAGPVLNPAPKVAGDGPLLVLLDGTWADAPVWEARLARVEALVQGATAAGRPVAVARLTDTLAAPAFQDGATVATLLPALAPAPWLPSADVMAAWADALDEGDGFDTVWLSDGLARDGRDALAAALQDRGALVVEQTPRPVVALLPPRFEDGAIRVPARRTPTGPEQSVEVAAIGPDPSGAERSLATTTLAFAPGAAEAEATFELPAELRNRVTRIEVVATRSAAGVALAGDSFQRRKVGLAATGRSEVAQLLSPLHYLRQALGSETDLVEAPMADLIAADPDAILVADAADLPDAEALKAWVEAGGTLVRFAGPRLAAAQGLGGAEPDPLLPVRLRAGGRSLGGAMSWGEPKTLAPFEPTSPFAGLAVPDEVTVTSQVVAEPDPTLASRVIAALSDGTPLVTRASLGEGQVILFHVTANAEWSSLPLSGLFPAMLDRLAVASRPDSEDAEALAGTTWRLDQAMDAWGEVREVDTAEPVPGESLVDAVPGPDLPPGLYAGAESHRALNAVPADLTLAPAVWPAGTVVEGGPTGTERPLQGWLLAAAAILLAADAIASLALGGRLRSAPGAVAVLLAALWLPADARAQQAPAADATATATPVAPDPAAEALALAATSEVTLAYVLTGDSRVDELSQAGLDGLSLTLRSRTSVEPGPAVGVDLERDELAFFPLIYWPITADQPQPSAAALSKVNRYLAGGGLILFDTRDAGLTVGDGSPEGRKLQAIAAGLDIPSLEPVPPDHVLTRTFYLLQTMPGRYVDGEVWVEASATTAEAPAEGMPFRDLNDGVTPVVIGGNDWASAWATDQWGAPLLPIGRGEAGDRQRELALRFGVNLVMHVLTGNYKSDQVHVPALLERLGQ